MRELSRAEQTILDTIDQEIDEIDEKLAPFQELIEQKNRLVKTKATLLNEKPTRSSSGSGGSGRAVLTHEQVTQAFRSAGEKYLTGPQIAEMTGNNLSTVRSHLNRGRGQMYKKKGDAWRLIGANRDDE